MESISGSEQVAFSSSLVKYIVIDDVKKYGFNKSGDRSLGFVILIIVVVDGMTL